MIKSCITSNNGEMTHLLCCHTLRQDHFQFAIERGYLTTEFSLYPPKDVTGISRERVNLVYTFYGLPLYKYKHNKNNTNRLEKAHFTPVGILLNAAAIHKAIRFIPFDSGAFFDGLYDDHCLVDSKDEIKNFEVDFISPHNQEVCQAVDRYFTTNSNYLEGKVDFFDDPFTKEEDMLVSLYNDRGISEVDRRAKAFEVHFETTLSFKDDVEAVIIHRGVKERVMPNIEAEIKNLNSKIEVLTYSGSAASISEYVSRMIHVADEHQRKNFLKH
ncbi:MAG: hypothetical protein IPP04_06915 [Saprospiraceae bacterium]|nr:hypothetical protein [Saprospiraceae bacterium]